MPFRQRDAADHGAAAGDQRRGVARRDRRREGELAGLEPGGLALGHRADAEDQHVVDHAVCGEKFGDLAGAGAARDDDVDRLGERPGRLVAVPQERGGAGDDEYGAERRDSCETERGLQCTAEKTSEALVPPKPNEFDSAYVDRALLAPRAARGRCRSLRDGLSRLSVGGTTWSRIARIEKIASTAAGRAEQVADRRLGRRHRQLVGVRRRTAA